MLDPSLHELSPNCELKILERLPMHYQQKLKAGETYQLLWPGSELNIWGWGKKAEHVGKELRSWQTRKSEQSKLILPASQPITFTTKEELEPWPERPETTSEAQFQLANYDEWRWRLERNPPPSPPPLGPPDRVAGAPILSLKIDCPREWTKDAIIDLKVKVTYEDGGGNNAKPITFHTTAFKSTFSAHSGREGTHIYQYLKGSWKKYNSQEGLCCGFAIFDDPPIAVNVGDEGKYSDQFATLRLGESWEFERRVQGVSGTSLPNDVKVGDRFKYTIKGVVVDWWDWGTKEDHKETAVKLPCFIAGDLEEPTNNGGRPNLVVSASNEIIFSYIG
ncbi:hypothetical protein K431DRAFT_316050 [Polychaeton citri CBS 116435]|uniref:Uncharacterized protein n=1 Tax=Polychaeton citri CBS 116435 TaxID=1314669 RepID=A0A9P4Q2E2_9PEZI|nr:hypothetical protein K431DRAFT_316050 [Polychaeton citri CBS 116435]